ncbi:unnamed protein product [Sphagnum balticum]
MSSNGDPAVSVVVAKDIAVVIASDDSDGDMQATVHSVASQSESAKNTSFCGSMSRIGRTSVLRKYENVVVDYIVEGGIKLRTAGNVCFKKFVVSLTNGYEPPLTRTIQQQIVELYRILEPLLVAFLCNLDVAISLTLDGWSNRNLKGFYVVTAHWVNIASLTNKSIFLTILDVKCGTGVSKLIGATLFKYLKRLG